MTRRALKRDRQRARNYVRIAVIQAPPTVAAPTAPAKPPKHSQYPNITPPSGLEARVGRRAESPTNEVRPPADWWNYRPRTPQPKTIIVPFSAGCY